MGYLDSEEYVLIETKEQLAYELADIQVGERFAFDFDLVDALALDAAGQGFGQSIRAVFTQKADGLTIEVGHDSGYYESATLSRADLNAVVLDQDAVLAGRVDRAEVVARGRDGDVMETPGGDVIRENPSDVIVIGGPPDQGSELIVGMPVWVAEMIAELSGGLRDHIGRPADDDTSPADPGGVNTMPTDDSAESIV